MRILFGIILLLSGKFLWANNDNLFVGAGYIYGNEAVFYTFEREPDEYITNPNKSIYFPNKTDTLCSFERPGEISLWRIYKIVRDTSDNNFHFEEVGHRISCELIVRKKCEECRSASPVIEVGSKGSAQIAFRYHSSFDGLVITDKTLVFQQMDTLIISEKSNNSNKIELNTGQGHDYEDCPHNYFVKIEWVLQLGNRVFMLIHSYDPPERCFEYDDREIIEVKDSEFNRVFYFYVC